MDDVGEIGRDATPAISQGGWLARIDSGLEPMDQDRFEDVLVTMIRETRSLFSVCKDSGKPTRMQVYGWMERGTEEERATRKAQYARARELVIEGWVEETADIADDASKDIRFRKGRDGKEDEEVIDREHISRSALRISTRQWLAKVLDPARFGERHQVRHADADGGKLPPADAKPPSIQFVVVDAPPRPTLRNVTPGHEEA